MRSLGRDSTKTAVLRETRRSRATRPWVRTMGVLVWTLVAASTPAWAAGHGKIDLVELTNGNQITCEVVSLQRGKLTAKTDAMGTLSIEWDSVRSLVSPVLYDVELSSGRQLLGSLVAAGPQRLAVRTSTGDEQ